MSILTEPTARTRPAAGPLLVTDLLGTGTDLAGMLPASIAAQEWLDAFLLTAGLSQIVEDLLHPDPFQLRRAAEVLAGQPAPLGPVAGAGLSAAAAVAARAGRSPDTGRLHRLSRDLHQLSIQLATRVLHPGEPADGPRLAAAASDLPAAAAPLAGEVVRLPACFRSFDQHPDDVAWLASAFLERFGRPSNRVCVLGVRTSGSYLAPLHVAALRARGVPQVSMLTYRPGRPFLRQERRVLRSLARAGGTVLVTDDPPGTGASVLRAVDAVTRLGVAPERTVLALSLFTEAPPEALRGRPAVLQPWPAWSVHRRLAPAAIAAQLTRLLAPGLTVDRVTPADTRPADPVRGHVRRRYTASVTDRGTGAPRELDLLVTGAGLGYLGRHALAIAAALPRYVPPVYGYADGLLLSQWLPPARPPQPDPDTIAGYVAARRVAVPARRDPTPRLCGRDPAWEVAAALLGGPFGHLAPAARLSLLEPLTRSLLAPEHPSVTDGRPDLRHWVAAPGQPGRPRKAEFDHGPFSNRELACYDAAFDLAGAAAEAPTHELGEALRAAYRRAGGPPVDEERWALYQLVHARRLRRDGRLDTAQAARRCSRAVHRYLFASYLSDIEPPGNDLLCAIDLDGVLETDRLGHPTTTPGGALALRALMAHGYSPVIVTGRSLQDARDRCADFRLTGAVAEYGSVIYDHRDGTVLDQRSAAQCALLTRLRTELTQAGADLDPQYRYIVRARRSGSAGPPAEELLSAVPALTDPATHVVPGQGQTDLTLTALDKGTGLEALLTRFGGPRLALAVGDTAADLPMLARAGLARAPRNADPLVRSAGVTLTPGAYQTGLLDACRDLLGHPPGRCAVCQPPPFDARRQALLAALALPEDGLRGLPRRGLRLARLTSRRSRW